VVIDNLARSGKSSKSFVTEGLWAKLLMRIRKGDWVIVQFGHNDVAKQENRRTTVDEYRQNFERFADDVTARGGRPVFVSPTCCWDFDSTGKFAPRAYIRERADAMKAAAQAKGAVFIDMTELTARELREKGKADTRIDYMISRIGNADAMHTTRWGAKRFAELFVREVFESGSPFAEIFKTPAGMKPKVKVAPVN
jgi:lysophospholipase L1-like esterase